MFQIISKPEVLAAIIASIVSVFAILIRDYFIVKSNRDNELRRSEVSVQNLYADPLLISAIGLFWRLREALTQPGRGSYLKTSGDGSEFERYKYQSTFFRLAELIGWIRAYELELLHFSLRTVEQKSKLNKALEEFHSALADGAHVEERRVQSVAKIWDVDIPNDRFELSNLAVEVEQILKIHGRTSSGDEDLINRLDIDKQLEICQKISDLLHMKAGQNPRRSDVVRETLARASDSLSIREAWLYRDYQAGLGDLVSRKSTNGPRRYEVIGFNEFESFFSSEDEQQRKWITRLSRIFEGLDISGADKFDARVEMLENSFSATINLIVALCEGDENRKNFARATIKEIEKLRDDKTWRKTAA